MLTQIAVILGKWMHDSKQRKIVMTEGQKSLESQEVKKLKAYIHHLKGSFGRNILSMSHIKFKVSVVVVVDVKGHFGSAEVKC